MAKPRDPASITSIIQLWNDQKSVREIATALSLTMNIVRGVLWRHHDRCTVRAYCPTPRVKKVTEATPQKPGQARPVADVDAASVEPLEAPVPAPAADYSEFRLSPLTRSLLTLTHAHCRWPQADRFCCAPAVEGKSYCVEHLRRSRGGHVGYMPIKPMAGTNILTFGV